MNEDFTIQCQQCGTVYRDTEPVCPYCGQPAPFPADEDYADLPDSGDYPPDEDAWADPAGYEDDLPYEDDLWEDDYPPDGYDDLPPAPDDES
ncbi:MAG: hypothetical protein D6784_17170, partial [Chloroflexi bacterium]